MRRVALAVFLAAVASSLLALVHPARALAAGVVNPPALWIEYNDTPSEAQLEFAAHHYRVAVFNPWETEARDRLKKLNPAVIVLAYKDVMSMRDNAGAFDVNTGKDATLIPTGVGYAYADSNHAEWFATDMNGNRIEWAHYPHHWQAAVWDVGYQSAWVANVAAEIGSSAWDGVLADNATPTLKYYLAPGVSLGGGRTDADVKRGVEELVQRAVSAFGEYGKLFIPNVTDGRITDGWWQALTAGGGGMDEQFMHWGTSATSGYAGDWPHGGWSDQASEMAGAGLNLAHTTSTDAQSSLYGYASFLIAGGGGGAFAATGPDEYGGTPLLAEQAWDPGKPEGEPVRAGAAWTRNFSGVFAAANPSDTTSADITLPTGLVDEASKPLSGMMTLAPHTGVVLRVASPAPDDHSDVVAAPSVPSSPPDGSAPATVASPSSPPVPSAVSFTLAESQARGPAVAGASPTFPTAFAETTPIVPKFHAAAPFHRNKRALLRVGGGVRCLAL